MWKISESVGFLFLKLDWHKIKYFFSDFGSAVSFFIHAVKKEFKFTYFYIRWQFSKLRYLPADIKFRNYIKESERRQTGKYCDKKGCKGPRADHVHGTGMGVTYHCRKHRKWAEKQFCGDKEG